MPPADGSGIRLRCRAAGAEVWEIDLAHARDISALDAGERRRAAAFRFERDRQRFERRRAALRDTLAGYTGVPAAGLRFGQNEFGKPVLAGGPHFSASSSGDLALVAVSGRHPVGVDIELVRPRGEEAELARRLFAPEEVESIRGVVDFFRCWSRKEAYVKAVGQGLSFPLASFAVETGETAEPRVLRSDLRPDDVTSVAMFDLSDSSNQFAACMVVTERSPLSS